MGDLTSGTYVQKLTALRDLLARQLQDAAPRDVASIARQYVSVLALLEELSVPKESDGVDEVTARRAARRAAANARQSP